MLELRGLSAGYTERTVLEQVDLALEPGAVTILLGPNGCGKSTLLRTSCGLLPKQGGEILLDGVALERCSARQIARKVAYLPQSRPVPSITARRMVLHGRFPYLSYPRRYGKEDYEMAARALRWVDAEALADCPVAELSGGQQQKVYLAMALAQNTETILMDEPTTYLDVRHQLEIMRLAKELAGQGKAVVMVIHDLCLAMETADKIAVLAQGRLMMADTPEKVYASGILNRVMEVDLCRAKTADGWRYFCRLPGKGGE